MSLIDRYLSEVGRRLPESEREDIVCELRSGLLEQWQERGGGAAAEAELLHEYGHPSLVAGRYIEHQYLIGPDLYPGFIDTLKTLLVVVLGIQVAVAMVVNLTAGWTLSVADLITQCFNTAFWVAGIVTLVFITIERSGAGLDYSGKWAKWDPHSLPNAEAGGLNRSDLVTNLITEGVFLLWWNNVLQLTNHVYWHAGEFTASLSSLWGPLFWPLNLAIGGMFCVHLLVLIRDAWSRWALRLEIGLGVAVVVLCLYLLLGERLFAVQPQVKEPLLDHLQLVARTVVLVIAGFQVWDLIKAQRLLRSITSKSAV